MIEHNRDASTWARRPSVMFKWAVLAPGLPIGLVRASLPSLLPPFLSQVLDLLPGYKSFPSCFLLFYLSRMLLSAKPLCSNLTLSLLWEGLDFLRLSYLC